MDSITKDDRAIESKAWPGAVPRNELANCVIVRSLAAGRREAVQHRCFGVFEIRSARTRFGDFLFRDFDFGIGDGLLRHRRKFHES
jgi:hypothetical protein